MAGTVNRSISAQSGTVSNWEFYAVVQGRCGVLLDHDEKLPLRFRRLWVFPPGHRHGWYGEEHCSVVVVHASSVPRQLVEAIPSSGIIERRITGAQCRQIEAIERAIEPDLHQPSPLSELHFNRAIIDLSVIALGGVLARPRRTANRRSSQESDVALT